MNTTSTTRTVWDAAHQNSHRLMWRGLAPAIMKICDLCGAAFFHGDTTSTNQSLCDTTHENSYRLMWRGLAPAIMKTLWAGVHGWVGRWPRKCGGGVVAGWCGLRNWTESLADPNFFKKSRSSADLLFFLFVRWKCIFTKSIPSGLGFHPCSKIPNFKYLIFTRRQKHVVLHMFKR